MISRIFLTVIAVCGLNMLSAQNLLDAHRYSFQNPTGSARFNATSGAMNAIGADITTGSHNPAGIAAFWKSELSLTGNMALLNTNASFISVGSTDKTSDFESTINNAGIVFTTYSPNKNWMAKSFSIGYNKLMDYDRETYFAGQSLGSISERWAGLAQGYYPDELGNFEDGIAYDAGVIYDIEGDASYEYDYFRHEDKPLDRNQVIDETGGWNELAVSFGGNYRNKLLIGMTIGIDFLNYTSEKFYTETNNSTSIPQFGELKFQEDLSASGIGINAKLGAIVKITPNINWSVFASSPTALSITENYTNRINYQWYVEDGSTGSGSGDSGEGRTEYSYINPWKVSTAVGYIIGKKGFVDAEIDYVGYNFSKFQFENIVDRDFENALNKDIDDGFDNAINFRIGGEYVLGAFRARAGYHFYGSPIAEITNTNGFSLGMGFRGENWFLDLSYLNRNSTSLYSPYYVLNAIVPELDLEKRVGNVSLTIGFKI